MFVFTRNGETDFQKYFLKKVFASDCDFSRFYRVLRLWKDTRAHVFDKIKYSNVCFVNQNHSEIFIYFLQTAKKTIDSDVLGENLIFLHMITTGFNTFFKTWHKTVEYTVTKFSTNLLESSNYELFEID